MACKQSQQSRQRTSEFHVLSDPAAPQNLERGTLSKSILVIAQACWELQTAGAVKGSTLDGTKILKSSIKQVSRKQNYLAPNFQKHGQQTMLRSMHEQEP